jgi:hypothetical protein
MIKLKSVTKRLVQSCLFLLGLLSISLQIIVFQDVNNPIYNLRKSALRSICVISVPKPNHDANRIHLP